MQVPSLLDDLGGPSASARAASLRELAGLGRPLPRLVAWNLARRCRRASCASCLLLAGPGTGPPGEFSTIESLHLAQQLVALHPALLLIGGGDALAREDLETIAAHAVRRGASVAVATPGGRLTDRRLDALQGAGVSGLVVTMPGTRPDASAGRHGDETAAESLAAAGRARLRGFRVVVHSLLASSSREAAAELARAAAESGAQALHVELAGEDRGVLAAERELALLERRLAKRLAIRVARRPTADGAGACACDALACRITTDAKLTACPCSSETLADLRRVPFASAWLDSPVLAARREARPDAAIDEPPKQQLALDFEAPR